MQWSAGPNAGFAMGRPWLPLADDCPSRNVEAECGGQDSMLLLYRRLVDLRREEAVLSVGDCAPHPAEGDVIAYLRQADDRQLLVALNLGHNEQHLAPDELEGRILLTTHLDREGEVVRGRLRLRPDEAVIAEIGV